MKNWIFLFLSFYVSSCIVIENQIEGLPPGKWRGVIKLDPTPVFNNPKGKPIAGTMDFEFTEVDAGELPFMFEISKSNELGLQIFSILNGDETVYSAPIQIGKDLSTAKDTINIRLGGPDLSLKAIFEENIMEGWWVGSKFIAWYGKDYLFTQLKKEPINNISGIYPIELNIQGIEQLQFGQLTILQNGNYISGELKLEEKDIIKLQGTIQRDKIYLSGVKASQAILLQAKIDSNGLIFGSYRDLNQKIGFWKITI